MRRKDCIEMKIRTIEFIAKEGVLNTYRNKLMSLASIGIIAASLIVFGVFILLSINVNTNIKGLENQPQLKVICHNYLDDSQVDKVEESIKSSAKISKYVKVSKTQALEDFRSKLGKDSWVLDNIDDEFLFVSFNIVLKDMKESREVANELEHLSGVKSVHCPQDVIDIISSITYWAKLICVVLVGILLIIAMFIISNTIKLTVFARRKEINIMKYIGATDWFIRWPFIIEGVIIGIVGAVVAFVPISWGYSAMGDMMLRQDIMNSAGIIKYISIKDIWLQVSIILAFTGSGIGVLGSLLSIRKHLRV